MGSQVLSHPDQIGLQSFGTQKVQVLAYDLDDPVDFNPIGPTSLLSSWLANQVAVDKRIRLFRCGFVICCISSRSMLRSFSEASR